MLLTDETGSGTATLAYSAFGEPVGDAAALPTRYQFAGGHGYESGLLTLPAAPGTVPLTFQHLGARWYQPNTGRFLQRDPIGLAGGMNVYAYCENDPVGNIDPEGQSSGRYWDPRAKRWRDRLTGRFTQAPWVRRAARSAVKNAARAKIVYWAGKQGAKGIYWTFGEPWPGDPEDLLWDTGVLLCTAAVRHIEADIKEHKRNRKPPDLGERRPAISSPTGMSCFQADTIVHTDTGPRRIAELTVGTHVLSSAAPQDQGQEQIVFIVSAWAVRIVELELGDEVLQCTPEHPFLLPERGWTRAGDLKPGDDLATATGTVVKVTAAKRKLLSQPVQVIDISVTGRQTFQVGRHRVIVHNKSF